MSSQRPTLGQLLLRRLRPSLFTKCPFGNIHRKRDRYCHCGQGLYSSTWHGGVLDLQSGREIWSGEHIAEHFFYELEKYHPLATYWEAGNRQSEGENYPYSYFKKTAIRVLEELIGQHAAGAEDPF